MNGSCILTQAPALSRAQRLITDDQSTVHHTMPRTAWDGFSSGDVEKDFMPDLIQRCATLYLA